MLVNIARKLPKDTSALLSCCSPVPPMLRMHSNDIVFLILEALEDYQKDPSRYQNSRPPKKVVDQPAPKGLGFLFSFFPPRVLFYFILFYL
jgi:hypothetical protein